MLGQRLDDGADIADVHRLFQQQLEDLLERCDGDHFRDHFFDELGSQLGHVLHQLLRFGAAEELGGLHLHQV